MSKLYNTYLALKNQDSETIYLFKSGVFFLAIDRDAVTLSNIFNFKLGKLNETIVKCGFPCSSINKYSSLFKAYSLTTKIIDSDNKLSYNFSEYKQKQDVLELLELINSVDINKLSITEAYNWIEDLKSIANQIIME